MTGVGIQVSVLAPGPVSTHFSATIRERHARVAQDLEGNELYQQKYAKRLVGAYELEVSQPITSVNLRQQRDVQENTRHLAATPEYVAKQLLKILSASWLRHRYCDSYTTWFLTNLYTWLPTWMTERLTAALFY